MDLKDLINKMSEKYKNANNNKNVSQLVDFAPIIQNEDIEHYQLTENNNLIPAATPKYNKKVPIGTKLNNALLGVNSYDKLNDSNVSNINGNLIIESGLVKGPRRGGIINDIVDGFKENLNNNFTVNNLLDKTTNDGRVKGFAYRLGEGIGTATKFADTPLGRTAITGGAIGLFGGSPLEMAAYGMKAGVGNQNLRTKNLMYRNSLEKQGIDTSSIKGYIDDNTFKNFALADYRNRNLDVKLAIANSSLDEKMKARLQKGFVDGIYSSDTVISAINNPELLHTNFGLDESSQLNKSNATRNAETREYLAPHQANAYDTGAMATSLNANTNAERLNLQQQAQDYKEQQDKIKTGNNPYKKVIDEGNATIADIKRGLGLINKNPEAFSYVKGLSPVITNRLDEKGIGTRTTINNITAVYRKWLTGAQMSDAERKSYESFLPAQTDNATIIKAKLNGMIDSINTKNSVYMNASNNNQAIKNSRIGRFEVSIEPDL